MTLTVISSDETDYSPPRMRLDVADSAGGNQLVAVTRTHLDGSTHQVITDRGARLSAGEWVGFDYHCPFGEHVEYVVTVAGVTSPPSPPLMLDADAAWLLHPSDPTLAVQIDYIPEGGLGDETNTPLTGIHTIVGSDLAVSVWDDTLELSSSMVLAVTPDKLTALGRLLRSGGALLLSAPAKPGWDVYWVWFQRTGTTKKIPGSRTNGGTAGWPYREISIPYRVIARPDIDLSPAWTCGLAAAEFATCAEIVATYATCADFATDTRTP